MMCEQKRSSVQWKGNYVTYVNTKKIHKTSRQEIANSLSAMPNDVSFGVNF